MIQMQVRGFLLMHPVLESAPDFVAAVAAVVAVVAGEVLVKLVLK